MNGSGLDKKSLLLLSRGRCGTYIPFYFSYSQDVHYRDKMAIASGLICYTCKS